MTNVDVNTFANEYEKAVRIFYNGLRSENANVQVYTSVDQQWARSSNAAWYYGSKPFLDAYNSIAKAGGDYDWHVATHPYDIPLYDPIAWSQSAHASHSQSSPYITMQNIDVLTDYLSQSSLLSPTGQVRERSLQRGRIYFTQRGRRTDSGSSNNLRIYAGDGKSTCRWIHPLT